MGRAPNQGNSAKKLLANLSQNGEDHHDDEQHQLLDDAISRLEEDSWVFSTPSAAAPVDDDFYRPAHIASTHTDDNDENTPSSQAATIAELMQQLDPEQYMIILIATGASYMVDAMEIVATYFLALRFQDTGWQCATVASSIFMGSLVGSGLVPLVQQQRWSPRRIFLSMTLLRPVVGCFTLLLATEFASTVMIRFLVGVLSGTTRLIAFSTLCDYSPRSPSRQESLTLETVLSLQFCWTAGVVFVAVMESMSTPHWITMIAGTEVLVLICCIFSICFLPESPSWLLRVGKCEQALLEIGNRCGPNFDWLVEIRSNNSENLTSSSQQWRQWGTWYGYGVLYYGAKYLINDIFHDSDEYLYYGTIVVSAEMEVFGILLAWFGISKLKSPHWTLISSVVVGGFSVMLLVLLQKDLVAVVFAVLARMGLLCAMTVSMVQSFPTTAWTICMLHMGGMFAPYLMEGPQAMIVPWLVLQTLFVLYCCWGSDGSSSTRCSSSTAHKHAVASFS